MTTAVKTKPKTKPKTDHGETIKMYKALVALPNMPDGITRLPGEFVPEALEWRNQTPWVNSKRIEICWVSKSEFEAWESEHALRVEAEKAAKAAEASQEVEEEKPPTSDETVEEVIETPRKVIKIKKKVKA